MSHRLILAALVALTIPRVSWAEVCPPAATLEGESTLVAAISRLLETRGVALDPPSCPSVRARVARRGDDLIVDVAGPDGARIERIVSEPSTAATVIESFSRLDVETPLLAVRPVRSAPVVDEVRAAPTIVAAAQPSPRGVQLFGLFETSVASDRTSWVGAQVGVCVMLGPVCAAARLRAASVVSGPGGWDDQLERRSIELLVGIDVPFSIRGMTFSPGFAAGLGQMHTRGAQQGMRSETGGVRADVHATLAIPFGHRVALELFTAADLTQETRVEWGPTMAPLPNEPRALLRVGIGLRYGEL